MDYEDFTGLQVSDSNLLQLQLTELVCLPSELYARFLSLKNQSFPQEYTNVDVGQLISVPFYKVYPDRLLEKNNEWDEAKPGQSQTHGPIEVKLIDKRKLIVVDGHNRLKNEIFLQREIVTVKIVECKERDCLITREEALLILTLPELPDNRRRFAEQIIRIWDSPYTGLE